MTAVDEYFQRMQGYGSIQVAHPAAVATGLRAIPPEMPAPTADTHPHTNESARMQGAELLATSALAECPIVRQLLDDHHAAQEVLQVMHQSLTFILSGNKAMYVPADELQSIMSEMTRQADTYLQARKLHPGLPVAQLKSAIGPGSQFAHRYRRHFEQHHPGHPASFEPHGEGGPDGHIDGKSATHHGRVNHELEHHFGYPLEHI